MVVGQVEGVSRWKDLRWLCSRHFEAGCVRACERALCRVMKRKLLCPWVMASWRYVVAVLSTAGRNRADADKTTAPLVEARVRCALGAFGPQIGIALRRKSYAAGRLPEAAVLDDVDQLFQMYLGDLSSSPCLFEESAAEALICLSLAVHLAPISEELLCLSAFSGDISSFGTSDMRAFAVVALAALNIVAVLYLMALWTLTKNEGSAGLSPKELDPTVLVSDKSDSLRMKMRPASPKMPAPIGPRFDRRGCFSCPPRMRDMGHLRIAVRNEDATARSGKKIIGAKAKSRYHAHRAVLDPSAVGVERNCLSEAGHAVTAPKPNANMPSWELATSPFALAAANVSWFQGMAVLWTFACNVFGDAQKMKLSHSSAGTQLLED